MNKAGSCVLVKLQELEDVKFGTFLTAYHVVHGAKKLNIYCADGKRVTQDGKTLCFTDRSRELAVIHTQLHREGDAFDALETDIPGEPGKYRAVVGFAATGLARGLRDASLSRPLTMTADIAELVDDDLAYVWQMGQLQTPGRMQFEFARGDLTIKGMSGGLVVDENNRFAGLLFGRHLSHAVIVPREQVTSFLVNSRQYQERWRNIAEDAFYEPSLFKGGTEARDDFMDWSTLEGLRLLMSPNPLGRLRSFQEIEVTPPRVDREAPDVVITTPLDNRSEIRNGEDSEKIRFWLDGYPLDQDDQTPIQIPISQRPGESLLVVSKSRGGRNDFELGRILTSNRVDLRFSQDGKEFFRLRRSLPNIVEAFTLYITLQNPTVSEDTSLPPPNLRLAFHLGFLQELLNQAPFQIAIEERSPNQADKDPGNLDSFVHATYRTLRNDSWQLSRDGLQRIGVKLNGNVDVHRTKFYRHELALGDPGTVQRFDIEGCLQFPYLMPDAKNGGRRVYLSARAIGVSGDGSYRLRLADLEGRDPISVEAGGILRLLMAMHVNRRLTGFNHPHLVNHELLRSFLRDVGLNAPKDWRLDLRRAVLRRSAADFDGDGDPRNDHWLVLTCSLTQVGAPARLAKSVSDAAPEFALGKVFEIEGKGIPASFLSHFHSLQGKNALLSEALSASEVEHAQLALRASGARSEWFTGLTELTDPIQLQGNGGEVSTRLKRAFRHFAQQGELDAEIRVKTSVVCEMISKILNIAGVKHQATEKGKCFLVSSNRSPDQATVKLVLEQPGSFSLRTPKATRCDLGGGSYARDIQLKVQSLVARGSLESKEVAASLEAELAVGELKTPIITGTDLSANVHLSLDTGSEERLGTLVVRGASINTKLAGEVIKVGVDEIRVRINRDTTFSF